MPKKFTTSTNNKDKSQIIQGIVNNMPLALWSCDKECKIVFWNHAAHELYGYSEKEVLGTDFVDLFVDPYEKEQARKDCIDIIDNKKIIRNIANDRDSKGRIRELLTCSFPSNINGEVYQTEISFEISDIDKLKEEICSLRDKHKKIENEKYESWRKLVKIQLDTTYQSLYMDIKTKIANLDKIKHDYNADKKQRETANKKSALLNKKLKLLYTWHEYMLKDISKISNKKEKTKLVSEIKKKEKGCF